MATAVKPTTVRVDENLKAQANEILGSVGLSYNTYVVMATHQLVNQRRIPFEIVPAGGGDPPRSGRRGGEGARPHPRRCARL